ncbi:MAG: RNA ligase [Thermoprotei archaeon]|nr:MAG: RNA ligase [Thermoprotei archaeon]
MIDYACLASLLNIDISDLKSLVGRKLRLMKYRDLDYLVFTREAYGYNEGTVILAGKEPMIVYGYPSIRRLAFLEAVSKYMPSNFVVEEKMDGYNVRVVVYNGKLLGITRGGYICPYTTARLSSLYMDKLRGFDREYPDYVLVGEVVGLDNPYVPVEYPEAPRFDLFIFDLMNKNKLQPLNLRDEVVEKYGLRRVRVLGVLSKNDSWRLWEIIDELERNGREGVVIKDPLHRVQPLKYTTIHTNIGDLRSGMRYPFDEGRSFLFPRILRLIAQGYEMKWDRRCLEKIAFELGMAILEPAIENLHKRAHGKLIAAEYKLVFPSEEDLSDYLEYMETLGIDIVTSIEGTSEEGIIVRVMKLKQTHNIYGKILETGLSPLD